MKNCKICKKEISDNLVYCGNKCKYSDKELNAKRFSKIKNDKTKILKCKICGWKTSDINNKGGYPIRHLKTHNITTDNYFNYYELNDITTIEKWTCPYCNEWSTIDLKNKSGAITTHLKTHNKTILELNETFPKSIINSSKLNRLSLLSNDYIICKICNQKLLSLSNSHLKNHGINHEDYKKQFGNDSIISNTTKKKLHISWESGLKDNQPKYISKSENEIVEYIKSIGITNIEQTYRKLGTEIDIFLPEYSIGIEFNGLYWHSEYAGNKNRNYHIDKTNICTKNGIRLIHIFEDEWLNKKLIVQSKLKHILHKSDNKRIYAKKCTIKTISSKEKGEFLNKNHIQGNDNANILLGLFYESKLISILTMSHLRISLGSKNSNDTEYELVRFASDINYTVVGACGKLIKHFIKNNNVSFIISYADLRYTNPIKNIYKELKFVLKSQSRPNYFYLDNYKTRLHRFGFTKQKLIKLGNDKNLTEWEIMQTLGYDRIWDCGSLKFKLEI